MLSLDVELLKQHKLEAKLYRDSGDLPDAQPIIHGTLALTMTGAITSDRMNGSSAKWHQASAQVKLLSVKRCYIAGSLVTLPIEIGVSAVVCLHFLVCLNVAQAGIKCTASERLTWPMDVCELWCEHSCLGYNIHKPCAAPCV